jgi:DNA topoisomerase IB
MRLRRSTCDGPGIRRRRRGKGFSYHHDDGTPVTEEELARIRALVIPPAWTDVWICPWPNGHIQAIGTDSAGRRQYRYHDVWRERRDHEKFDRMLELGERLPALRSRVAFHLRGEELSRDRVLAAAVRLLDTASFRIGGEEYAEENDTYGLASLRRRHLQVRGAEMVFDFPAKLGVRRLATVSDAGAAAVFAALKARRSGSSLLACRHGSRWKTLHAEDVNAYLKEWIGDQFSAKDFRTWNATVLAAVRLARVDPVPASERARRRAVTAAIGEVAEYLGNTVTVCRGSYVDPRLFEVFERSDGRLLRSALEGKRTRRGREVAGLEVLGSKRVRSAGRKPDRAGRASDGHARRAA